ncbi:MAG: class I SAM-dependent methyltransferase [Actinomycetia bacterium]|nr:class I SAM-dependent methyltransferase [Actinomycetes bacterium]
MTDNRDRLAAAGLEFGSVADAYERHRLGYSGELADVVFEYAGGPARTALEVGAGTGKATRVFAARGVAVTALEPDPRMARVLRRMTRGLPVEPVVAAFERYQTTRRFDLVFAAASWHWTDPATRWTRAVELLAPHGVLALFSRPTDVADPQLAAALCQLEEELLPADSCPSAPADPTDRAEPTDPAEPPAAPLPGHPWSVAEMAAVDGLVDVTLVDLPRVLTMPADDFVARLGTVSAYLRLDATDRADALRRVRAALPDPVAVDASMSVYLGHRPG